MCVKSPRRLCSRFANEIHAGRGLEGETGLKWTLEFNSRAYYGVTLEIMTERGHVACIRRGENISWSRDLGCPTRVAFRCGCKENRDWRAMDKIPDRQSAPRIR